MSENRVHFLSSFFSKFPFSMVLSPVSGGEGWIREKDGSGPWSELRDLAGPGSEMC